MNTMTVIRNDADVEKMRQSMQDEMGLTDAEWWQKTDPNDPPLKAGDKVWIEEIAGGSTDTETIKLLREPQVVEKVTPVPCSDGPLWSVDLVGVGYLFTQHNLRKV